MFDKITSVLPRHSTEFERALEQASMWVVQRSEIVDVWNPDTCPLEFLPWLAWSVSVDEWNSDWPAEVKRKVIRSAVEVHRRKGTKGAVLNALVSLGMESTISEWFEHGGASHTFCIDVLIEEVFEAGFHVNPALVAEVDRVIRHVKPARSHYDLRLGERLETTIYARTGYRQSGKDTTPRAATPPAFTINATSRAATGMRERAFDRATFTPIERSAA